MFHGRDWQEEDIMRAGRLLVVLVLLAFLIVVTPLMYARPVQLENPTEQPTEQPTEAPTNTSVPPTEAPTNTPVPPTDTPVPTSTDTPTPTDTPNPCYTPAPTATTMDNPILVNGGPRFLMVPAAAFQPPLPIFEHGAGVYNNGAAVGVEADPMYGGVPRGFIAPVYLPHGAQITKLTLYGYDDDPSTEDCIVYFPPRDILLELHRAVGGLSDPAMAVLSTSGAPGMVVISTTNFLNPIVDNQQYYYYLKVRLSGPMDENHKLEL
jgi:hypothetical protein